jgi:hypothetical protein
MRMNQYIKYAFLAPCSLGISVIAFSQDTTGKKRTIDITSSFKPVLREAVKINFNAAAPVVDSSKPRLSYNIPQQNLLLGYLPVPLKPVALEIDTVTAWKYSNYIKAGIGNVHIPYLQAGFSFGDGKNSFFNIFANEYTSKGKLPFQKNNFTAVSAAGTVKTAANLEWNGKLGFKSEDYFFYGYQPSTLVFSKDQLRQRFQTFGGKLSLRNLVPTEYGLTYNPNLKVDVFGGENNAGKATETNTVLNLPLNKTFGRSFGFNLGFTADLTNYKAINKSIIQNNLYYISPSVQLKTPNLFITTGVIPSWDHKVFNLLPNIMADITTNDQRFTIQLGWIGYYDKGSYQRFAGINPWIDQPTTLLNTKVQEWYAGFKGSVLDHISYSAKLGFVQYNNMPLFVNDTIDGKTFNTVYSSSLQAVRMHGEIGWTQGEDLNWITGLTINHYSKVQGQAAPWGLAPVELNSSLRWQLFKDFYLKGDLYFYDGAAYRSKISSNPAKYTDFKGESGLDLNAGVEFKITRQLNLWLQLNDLFNDKYERWHQYPVYGFNVLGGIVFSFNQK